MRHLSFIAFISLFLISCGTVAPIEKISTNDWQTYNHKTSFHVKRVAEGEVYLTVKYGSYTFTDKSSEMVPTAKTVFDKVANHVAVDNGYIRAAYEGNDFYESVAYNGITGVSTVLVSNKVSLLKTRKSEPINSGSLSDKLKQLKDAYESGLLTEEEYIKSKSKLLDSQF